MKNDIPNIIETKTMNFNGEELTLILEKLSFDVDAKAYLYLTIENSKREIVAESSYKINKDGGCFLIFIEVIHPRYINKGIGSRMLKFIERDAKKYGAKFMCGYYEPFGQFADNAKKFYKKNKYNIMPKGNCRFNELYKKLTPNEPDLNR